MVVVRIETAQCGGLVGSFQSPFYIAIFRTVASLQRQTAVGPQWSLGAKPMRRLDPGDQQSGPNRTDIGNLAQQLGRLLLAALRQGDPVAPVDATSAGYPAAGRTTRRAGARPLPES